MRSIRDCAEARWLPSRFRYALFRLFAYVKLRQARPEPRPGLLLVVDRDQNPIESSALSLWVLLTLSAWVTYELMRLVPAAAAVVLAPLAAAVLIELPLFVICLPLARLGVRMDPQASSVVFLSLLTVAAGWYALVPAWVRFVSWQFLAGLGLNGAAALVAFALRRRIAAAEAQYGGGSPSAA